MKPKHLHLLRTGAIFLVAATVWLPQAQAENRKCYAGIYLHDVTKFDQKDGVFDADFVLWVKWRGEFDPERLAIANASIVERESLGRAQDGDWHTERWRVRGTLRGEFPVQRFPFDQQTLRVELELPERYGELAPDLAGSGMSPKFSISGWKYEPNFFARMKPVVYHSDLGAIEGEGLPTPVNRASFEVTLHRPLITAATKLFLPLLVILLVAFVALFVHPKKLEVRASVGVTALLACFAFHFAVSDAMPDVTYITLAETLFLISYGVCAALLIVSVAVAALDGAGHSRMHKLLDGTSLFVLPLAFAGTAFVAVPSPPERLSQEAEVVKLERPASSRDILRIGTSSLPLLSPLANPNYNLVGRSAYWGTSRTPPGDSATPFPVLVSEVPGVTNGSLRFLAKGGLEVTWRLLPDLHWSDGEPLTAADLLFALEVAGDRRIQSKNAAGQQLVVLYRDRVTGALDEIVPLPRHKLEKVFEEGGARAVRDVRNQNALPSVGAYRVEEWEKDKVAILEANDHFMQADPEASFLRGAKCPPSIRRIEIHHHPESDLIWLFEHGKIDMIYPNAVSPETVHSFADKRPEAVKILASDLLLFLHPDLSNQWLSQPAFRKALLQCFNRERLRDDLFGDAALQAPIAHIPVRGALPGGVKKINYDFNEAKSQLEPFAGASIPLFYEDGPVEQRIVDQLVSDAASAGVTLRPEVVESRWTEYRKPNHGGLLLMQRPSNRSYSSQSFWGLPRQISPEYGDHLRKSKAFDQTIEDLFEREERALYPERRDQIRDVLFVEFSERLPLLPLLFWADHIVADPALKGLGEHSTGSAFGLNVENWYFEAPAEESATP